MAIKPLAPFRLWVLQNFPFIAEDFDALTNYELMCKIVEYLNNVIDVTNNQTNEINNLLNWFNNLDVQEEINNKLDKMVEDGTLAEIIEPYMENLTNEVQIAIDNANTAIDNANTASDTATSMVNQVGTIVNKLRHDLSREYTKFELPETMNNWFKNITILKAIDKNNYNYILDLERLKNTGGNIIYVDCNNADTGDGTELNPYKSLKTALSNSSDNDTIIVKEGIYYRQNLNNTSSQSWNNVNIICEPHTLFTTGEALTWTQNETYSNVYQANRTNVQDCIDIRNRKRDLLPHLTRVSSIQNCSNTTYSWYTDNSIVYVNLGENVTNDKILCNLQLGYRAFNMIANSKALHIYIENATFIAGRDGIIRARGTDTYDMEFIANNCKFLYSPVASIDGLPIEGAKSILVNCEASFNSKDGFNYHSNENTKCYAIEVNCIAQANGLGDAENHSYNGSTIHDGGQIIRINGNYFDNNGGNITDIDSNTVSLNFNCNCFDSQANTEDEYCTDFTCKYGTVKMYLYNCFAQGKSYKNMYCSPSTAQMTLDNCKYDSIDGNGTFIIN